MKKHIILILPLILIFISCGEQKQGSEEMTEDTKAVAETNDYGIEQDDLENGFGPIRNLQLSEYSSELAAKGEEIFKTKCMSCHRFEKRFTAPKLGDVLKRRTPEFVVNMMLNPTENVEKHPIVNELLKEYNIPMVPQGVSEEDALAVLEYIRGFPENK